MAKQVFTSRKTLCGSVLLNMYSGHKIISSLGCHSKRVREDEKGKGEQDGKDSV
jgi:hypothetical protein